MDDDPAICFGVVLLDIGGLEGDSSAGGHLVGRWCGKMNGKSRYGKWSQMVGSDKRSDGRLLMSRGAHEARMSGVCV